MDASVSDVITTLPQFYNQVVICFVNTMIIQLVYIDIRYHK